MRRRMIGIGAISLLFFFGIAGIAFNPAQAGPPKEFVIHHIGDITGPYAPITGAAAMAAMEDFEEYINAHGGLKGAKVDCVLHDTRNKRDTALSYYSQVVAEKPPLIFLHQSADMEILKERVAEDKVPALCFSPTPKTIWPPGWLFQTLPEYTDQFGLFIDWMLRNWEGKKKPKLAFLNPDYPYGHSVLTPPCLDYLEKKGVELVAKEFFPPFDVDVTTQMTRLLPVQPDWIYSMTIASQPRVVLKAAEALGMLGRARFGMGCWGMDVGAARVAGGLMEGVVGVQPYWTPADADKEVRMAEEVMKIFKRKNRKPEQFTMAYCAFWMANALALESLTKTIDRAGWDGLNGPAVYDTLVKTTQFGALGLQPFKFSPGKRSPLFSRVTEIKNSQCVPITDWLPCPDLRPAEFK